VTGLEADATANLTTDAYQFVITVAEEVSAPSSWAPPSAPTRPPANWWRRAA
jgi:hypothetical protein